MFRQLVASLLFRLAERVAPYARREVARDTNTGDPVATVVAYGVNAGEVDAALAHALAWRAPAGEVPSPRSALGDDQPTRSGTRR